MFFGKKLKELRIKYAKVGIHKFREKMGSTRSIKELMDIEHGYALCPGGNRFFTQVRIALNLSIGHEDWKELIRLSQEPFVMQKMPELLIVSPFAQKTDGSSLTEEEGIVLQEHISFMVKEHNKKAEEYNKQHNGL